MGIDCDDSTPNMVQRLKSYLCYGTRGDFFNPFRGKVKVFGPLCRRFSILGGRLASHHLHCTLLPFTRAITTFFRKRDSIPCGYNSYSTALKNNHFMMIFRKVGGVKISDKLNKIGRSKVGAERGRTATELKFLKPPRRNILVRSYHRSEEKTLRRMFGNILSGLYGLHVHI